MTILKDKVDKYMLLPEVLSWDVLHKSTWIHYNNSPILPLSLLLPSPHQLLHTVHGPHWLHLFHPHCIPASFSSALPKSLGEGKEW